MRYFLTLSVIFFIAALLVVAYLFSGWFDVSASRPEYGALAWVLDGIAERSVESHAESVSVPDLSRASLETGFRHYREMCVVCHGAPGARTTEISQGLNPPAPDLQRVAKEADARELYWIVKHGIRMTGMPAFGKTHSEDELWAMVAFVRRLPGLSPEQYKQLDQKYREGPEQGEAMEHQY